MCPWSTARRPYQQPNQLYRTILDKPRLREGPGARSPRLLAVAVADLVPAMDENRVCRPTRGTCSLSLGLSDSAPCGVEVIRALIASSRRGDSAAADVRLARRPKDDASAGRIPTSSKKPGWIR